MSVHSACLLQHFLWVLSITAGKIRVPLEQHLLTRSLPRSVEVAFVSKHETSCMRPDSWQKSEDRRSMSSASVGASIDVRLRVNDGE